MFSIDSSLLIAIGASFVVGMTGYIIVWFWIKPIVRYTITKRRIFRRLNSYLAAVENTGNVDKKAFHKKNPLLKDARKFTMALANCYNDDIPYWYRLLLDSRQESPDEALGLISHLSKLKGQDNIRAQINKVKLKLGLK